MNHYLYDSEDEGIPFETLQKADNLTDYFTEDQLGKIAGYVIRGYEIDESSRSEWLENNRKGMDVAMQKIYSKSHPWPDCSNIRFPLIAEAVNMYASRAVPEIIQNGKLVKPYQTGDDPDDVEYVRGLNTCRCISYQLLHQSKTWKTGLVKLIYSLSVVGTLFKKTYWDPLKREFVAELCTPDKVVVNNNVSSLDDADRITQIIDRSTNYIKERQMVGLYNPDVKLEDLCSGGQDHDAPVELHEQHCWWDLDNDGYKEPYVIVVHKPSGKVLRIVNRFDEIKRNENKEIVRITAEQYFIDYHFIRAFDGSFYSIGFGTYLLPLNEAASSLMNQLIDAGTLSITQAGFFTKDIRVREGEMGFKQGRWRVLDAAGGVDLSKAIYPLPAKDPSPVLLQLLQLIIQTCKDLAATTDVMQGKSPGQNTASSTVNALLGESKQSFVAINEGVFDSLAREFERLYKINAKHLTATEYRKILNNPEADVKNDFDINNINIRPVADPSLSSQSQRLQKAIAVQQAMPTADPRQKDLFMASAMQLDQSWEKRLFPPPPENPQPSPEEQKIMAQAMLFQAQAASIPMDAQLESEKNSIALQKVQIQMQQMQAYVQESMARITKMMYDAADNKGKLALVSRKLDEQAEQHMDKFGHQQIKDAAELDIKQEDLEIKAAKVGLDVVVQSKQIEIDKEQEKEAKNKGEDAKDEN